MHGERWLQDASYSGSKRMITNDQIQYGLRALDTKRCVFVALGARVTGRWIWRSVNEGWLSWKQWCLGASLGRLILYKLWKLWWRLTRDEQPFHEVMHACTLKSFNRFFARYFLLMPVYRAVTSPFLSILVIGVLRSLWGFDRLRILFRKRLN